MTPAADLLYADAVIVGGGLTGTLAARELLRAGLRVLLLRDGRGASPGVAGFNIAGAVPGDTPACFLSDTEKSAGGIGDPVLERTLCEESATLPAYLADLGFFPDHRTDGTLSVRQSLGSTYARVAGHGNTSGADILALADTAMAADPNFTLLEHTRAVRLLPSEEGIGGVLAYDREKKSFLRLQAPAVLLASGGYAGLYPFTSNPHDLTGDGMGMALLAGAPGVHMEFVQFEPSSAVYPDAIRGKGMITTLLYEGAVLRNAEGERFMLRQSTDGERVNKDVLARAIAREIREGRGTLHGGVWFDCTGVPKERMESAYLPFLRRYRAVGIDLFTQPAEVACGAHTALGGVLTDGACRTSLPGLFAAGEAMGTLHGANRIGGSAGSETLIFSRVAAHAMAEYLRQTKPLSSAALPVFTDGAAPLSAGERSAIADAMKTALGRGAGVLRREEELNDTLATLRSLHDKVRHAGVRDAEELAGKLTLENRLVAALALAESALLRTDSLGCHTREDFPAPPAEPYRTVVTVKDGVPSAHKQSLSPQN